MRTVHSSVRYKLIRRHITRGVRCVGSLPFEDSDLELEGDVEASYLGGMNSTGTWTAETDRIAAHCPPLFEIFSKVEQDCQSIKSHRRV